MDSKELRQKTEHIRAAAVGKEAEQSSRSRAQEAEDQVQPENRVRVGNQLTKDLIVGLQRLHSMEVGDHPAVEVDNVRTERHVGFLESTIFNLGQGTFVRVSRFIPPEDRPDVDPEYRMVLSDNLESLIDPSSDKSHEVFDLGSVSLKKYEGFYPEFSPGYASANSLVPYYEAMENMRTLEQELGLEPLLSVPFELPEAA
jgi:hypothetical protein